jgi:hypothetical protein
VLGMVTGIGGGMARDLLLAEIPLVLRAELYAVAALVAAAIVVIGHLLHWPLVPVTAVALIACFALRVMAINYGWRLPVAKIGDRHDADGARPVRKIQKNLSPWGIRTVPAVVARWWHAIGARSRATLALLTLYDSPPITGHTSI